MLIFNKGEKEYLENQIDNSMSSLGPAVQRKSLIT